MIRADHNSLVWKRSSAPQIPQSPGLPAGAIPISAATFLIETTFRVFGPAIRSITTVSPLK